jgi:hypothetical protein
MLACRPICSLPLPTISRSTHHPTSSMRHPISHSTSQHSLTALSLCTVYAPLSSKPLPSSIWLLVQPFGFLGSHRRRKREGIVERGRMTRMRARCMGSMSSRSAMRSSKRHGHNLVIIGRWRKPRKCREREGIDGPAFKHE